MTYTKKAPCGRDWFDLLIEYSESMIKTVYNNFESDTLAGYCFPSEIIQKDIREITETTNKYNNLLSELARLPAEIRACRSFVFLQSVGAIE